MARRDGKGEKLRADLLLFELGLAASVEEAAALIMAGKVVVLDPAGREAKLMKAGEQWPRGTSARLLGEERRFVSRSGRKLEAALDAFSVRVEGRVCADFGVSTGGFSDCLLSRGAAKVYAVDVAYGVLAWKLRQDPRLVLFERTNVRTLPPGFFGEPVELAVVDLSFISLGLVLPAITAQLTPAAELVLLVKPQFELPWELVAGGVVQSEALRAQAVAEVRARAEELGLQARGVLASPVHGADGNVEQLLYLERRR